MKLRTKITAVLAGLCIAIVSAGSAYSLSSRHSETVGSGSGLFFGYEFYFRGLTPGAQYSAKMFVYENDNDQYPYVEGLWQSTVRSDGTVMWQLPKGEFSYYKPEVGKVTGCLTYPSWPYDVVKDQNGKDICRTIYVDDDGY